MELRFCKNCGKPFEGKGVRQFCTTGKMGKVNGSVFDMSSCYYKYTIKKQRENRRKKSNQNIKDAICVKCGKDFVTTFGFQRFCSKECAHVPYRNQSEKYKNNVREYKRKNRDNINKRKMGYYYRDREEVNRKRRAKNLQLGIKRGIKTKNCQNCGNEFIPYNGQKFCTKLCYEVFGKLKRGIKKNNCKNCGNEFIHRTGQKFCKKVCYQVFKKLEKSERFI